MRRKIVRLEKIENNTEVDASGVFLDYIDCGEFFFLTKFLNSKNPVMITLNQNTVLEDIQEKYGGYVWYYKLCKTAFRTYLSEKGNLVSYNLDEVVSWTEVSAYKCQDGRILKALITEEGLKELNTHERIIRWPNKNGGRGEHWYWLVENKKKGEKQ
jgi:hypothetical protein